MASATAATWNKRDRRHGNMGTRRKAGESKHSTDSYAQLFAKCGEPGLAVGAKAPAKTATAPKAAAPKVAAAPKAAAAAKAPAAAKPASKPAAKA